MMSQMIRTRAVHLYSYDFCDGLIVLRCFMQNLAKVLLFEVFFIEEVVCPPKMQYPETSTFLAQCQFIQNLMSELKIQKSTLFKAVLISMTLLAVTSYPSSIVIEGTGMTCWRISK